MEWGGPANPAEYSTPSRRGGEGSDLSAGEKDRICQHVTEWFLDDREYLEDTRLKVLCKVGALPVVRRVGMEQESGPYLSNVQ
jgi:hypothetical protein